MRASLVRAFAVPIAPARPGADPPNTLVLVVPVTQSDHLDEAAFPAFADVVSATWEGTPVTPWPAPRTTAPRVSAPHTTAPNAHVAGGPSPSRPALLRPDPRGWLLQPSEMEDAPPWRLEAKAIRPGGYLTLWAPNGSSIGLRIVNVEPLG